MRAIFSIVSVACLVFMAPCTVTAQPIKASTSKPNAESTGLLLKWHNGNTLPGELISGNASEITWRSELFTDDIKVNLSALETLQFPNAPSFRSPKQQLALRTVYGDLCFGDLVELSEDHLVLKPTGREPLKFRRDSILSVESSGTVDMTNSLVDWAHIDQGQTNPLEITDGGTIVSTQKVFKIGREMELPEQVYVDCAIRWEKPINFVFGFGNPQNNSDMIKKTSSVTVQAPYLWIKSGYQKKGPRAKLENEVKELSFRIHWDRLRKLAQVYYENGELMFASEVVEDPNVGTGIYLASWGSATLEIERFAISPEASGQSEEEFSNGGIRLTDGSTLEGNVFFGEDGWEVENFKTKKRSRVPSDSFQKAQLGSVLESVAPTNSKVLFHDQSFVKGDLLSISDNRLFLSTRYWNEPVSFERQNVSNIELSADRSDETRPNDRIKVAERDLIGRLSPCTEEKGNAICWQTEGASVGTPLAIENGSILLQEVTGLGNRNWKDVLCFRDGQQINCRIISLGEDVVVESYGGEHEFNCDRIASIDMAGIQDADWYFSDAAKENVWERDANSMVLDGPGIFGRQQMLSQGKFGVKIDWKSLGIKKLKIYGFLSDPEKVEDGLEFQFFFNGDHVTVKNAESDGQNRPIGKFSSRSFTVEFENRHNSVILYVDGKEVSSWQFRPESLRGSAFSMNLIGGKGLALHCLTVNTTGPQSVVVAHERLNRLLTFPRLSENDPPTHIVRGRNGDLLRGKLVEIDGSTIVFESRFDRFEFARESISTLIWLPRLPVEGEDVNQDWEGDSFDTASDAEAVMVDGSRIVFDLKEVTETELVGDSALFGKCVLPIEDVAELHFGDVSLDRTLSNYRLWVPKLAPEPK